MGMIKPLDPFFIHGTMGVPVEKPSELGENKGFIAWKGFEQLLRKLELLKPNEKVAYYAGGNGGISFFTKERLPYTPIQVAGVAKTWVKHLSSQRGPEMEGYPGKRRYYTEHYRTAIDNLSISETGDRLVGGSHRTYYWVNGKKYHTSEGAAKALNELEGIPDAKT